MISKRELYFAGEPFGDSATRMRTGARTLICGGGGSGGGGGGNTTSTVTNYSVPEWLKPQTEALMGAATQEFFQTDPSGQITGVKPFTPYSSNPEDYVAPFSPLQNQVFGEAANMSTPGQFGPATDLSAVSGAGQLSTVNPALGFGNAGAAAGLGFGQAATDPSQVAQYMSPYIQNVLQVQKDSAIRDAQVSNLANNLAAARQGTYGGARNLLDQSEASRNLQSQLANIDATGLQNAFTNAQQQQQFATNAAMQGAGVGLQGIGAAQAGFGAAGQQAGNLANIGAQQQASDLARLQAQSGLGNQQQQQQQSIIDQAIQNFSAAQGNAQNMLEAYSALLHGYASPTVTTDRYTAAPSTGSQLAGLGLTGLGLATNIGKARGGKINKPKQGIDTLAMRNLKRRAS